MLSEDQKRILGYFIEEAKDHLNTIEQGLLNLQTTIEDAEMVNEVFRAAHSVKGGAAMLGLNSIQRTSHRLEDFFKLMKETPPQADRDLESMLLRIFDGLQEQLDQLQSPYGLSDEQAQDILSGLEPVFAETESHLQTLIEQAPVAAKAAPASAPQARSAPAAPAASHPETSALQLVFQSDVPALLREMLTTFKQPDTASNRQDLGQICQRFNSIGVQFELTQWIELVNLTERAVTNTQQSFRALAPIIIKNLKQAQDLILAGRAEHITPTSELLALVPAAPAAEDDSALDALLAEALEDNTPDQPDLADLFTAAESEESTPDAADDDSWLDQVTSTETTSDVDYLEAAFDSLTAEVLDGDAASADSRASGVEVGDAELNSLADLFEGDAAGLEAVWEEEELADTSSEPEVEPETNFNLEDDLADLLDTGTSPPAEESEPDDFDSLFDTAFDASPDRSTEQLVEKEVSLTEPPASEAPAPAANPGDMDDFFAVEPGQEQNGPVSDPDDIDDFFETGASPGMGEPSLESAHTPAALAAPDTEPTVSAPSSLALEEQVSPQQPDAESEGSPREGSRDEANALDDLFEAADDTTNDAAVDPLTGDFDALFEDDTSPGDVPVTAAEGPEETDTAAAATTADSMFDDLDLDFSAVEQESTETELPDSFDDLALDDLDIDNSESDPGHQLDDANPDQPAGAPATAAGADMTGVLDELDFSFEADIPDQDNEADELDFSFETESLDVGNVPTDLEPSPEATDEETEASGTEADNFTADLPDVAMDLWDGDDQLTDAFGEPNDDLEQGSDLEPDRAADLTTSEGEIAPDQPPLTDTAPDVALDFAAANAAPEDVTTDEDLTSFDDLDDLLASPAASDSPTEHSDDAAGGDSFDDLEALLGEEDEPSPEPQDFDVTAEAGSISPSTTTEELDEFSDLEKLLEDTDQLGGSSPSLASRRVSAAPTARRAPRRNPTVTDQTMRVSVSHLDILSNLVGELVVNRNSLEQDQERLRQFLDNLLGQVQQLNDVGQRMRDLYERSLLESSLISSRQAVTASSPSNGSNSHATGATFDALEMDRFTGFHTLSQEMIELIVRVREAASDIEFTVDSSDQITRQFRQVTTQLQEGLNKARMVPFGQTADRLPRAVRDISLKCGKEARLVVEGRDTLIDKMILERLYDPVTHLVNNAITHGIEPPEAREANGKSREGTITIRAFYQGNQTVIYIADDGGGINSEVVKAKALKRGLITPTEAEEMSEVEVYDLLFLPGFSTRDQADDFSGRGVGMDVVRTALSEIRGAITIESNLGQGTSFTIRLPLTLSNTKALSCVNNQARIAFPMDGVEDMFDVPRERIQTNEQDMSCILWRDTLLPFRPLSDLLQFNRGLGRGRVYGGTGDDNVISIVVLRSASTFIGLQVDQVIGEQEIVIKQLEGPVPKPMGIAGATVMGDGRVMPIADVLELIDLATGRARREAAPSLWGQAEEEAPAPAADREEPTVLIVDDSITVRELLSMSFNKVGYRVEQARDGQEAWEKLRSGLPCDLVFCDIEMPRMDGLELLSRLQKDEQLAQIPIAMLTSRGADRHRQMAVELGASGYFTKPYLEEMLLDAAQRMLNGENMITVKAETQSQEA